MKEKVIRKTRKGAQLVKLPMNVSFRNTTSW